MILSMKSIKSFQSQSLKQNKNKQNHIFYNTIVTSVHHILDSQLFSPPKRNCQNSLDKAPYNQNVTRILKKMFTFTISRTFYIKIQTHKFESDARTDLCKQD